MRRNTRNVWLYVLVIVLLALTVSVLYTEQDADEVLRYSDIVSLFENERVKKFTVEKNTITMELYPEAGEEEGKTVRTSLASVTIFMEDLSELISEQRRQGIIEEYEYVPAYEPSFLVQMIPYIIIIVAFVAVWYYMINQSQGGSNRMLNFGKAKYKGKEDEKRQTTFADVAGAKEEKEELVEVVDFLRNPGKYVEIGARIPRGILLVGPPGTGKTLLARAVAGEANVRFFSISGSDFVEMFVGVGASRVRDLFGEAKRNAPSIVFIDEIDAVGRHRGAGLGGGHDEREQTLNQLLVEMDGFGTNEGVIVIAATNRADILDPALLRPGRFDRQIVVNMPDIKGREEILHVHARGKPFEDDVDLAVVAKSTPGFTGADLENLLNEAAILAARNNHKKISVGDVSEANLKVLAGPEKRSRVISEKEKRLTAYHEAGHAIVRRYLPNLSSVHTVSIIPRGMAGGFTMALPEEDKYYISRNEMMEEIASALGGRVAEQLVLGDISTGASGDIERATSIARKMVTQYGMSENLPPMSFGGGNEVFLGRDFTTTKSFSESLTARIDDEIINQVAEGYRKAEEILSGHIDKLHEVAKALLEHETIDSAQFEAFFAEEPPPEKVTDTNLLSLAAAEAKGEEDGTHIRASSGSDFDSGSETEDMDPPERASEEPDPFI